MAEGYKPTAGMKAAARKAIKFKEDGKAKGAGTAVGWTRARQLVNGETLSLDTVKRMYSFFSRHEVDKKGKDWGNQANPSNGYIMWLAWGGDAGFSWSRKIVNKEKNMNKSMFEGVVEEIKSMLDEAVNPITETIEIEDDSVEKMDGQTDLKVEEELDTYHSDNEEEDKWDNIQKACWTGYKQVGMKDKNGKQVPNCVPIEKAKDMETEEEPKIKKSLFGNLDPYELVKRKFSSKQREEMASSGEAMPDGSYPIANKTDLMNAIRSWGRGGADPEVKAHIKRRAKALGLSDMIPDNWK